MASATVTLKASPKELRVIRAALKMYVHVNKNIHEDHHTENRLSGFQHDLSIVNGDPRHAVVVAGKIIQEIG